MKLFDTLFKKNLEKSPSSFQDINIKLNDSFSIRKIEVNPQVEYEKDENIKQSME